jgi:hypothetical protein
MRTHSLAAFAVATALLVSGCQSNIQTTSGQAYLDKYKPTVTAASAATSGSAEDESLESRMRRVAAVEPTLRFPARIGLARIENGELSGIPREEGEAWATAAESLGSSFGEFVPISPLLAEMVTDTYGLPKSSRGINRTIDKIRLGAARQHLDAVLIYETYGTSEQGSNPLKLLNLTLIGAFILPGESINAEGFASALLLDVWNGYPYGMARKVVARDTITPTVGSDARRAEVTRSTATRAAVELAPEVEQMFRKLQPALAKLDAKDRPAR